MTATVVFLVKNGIGFGHLRRARLLAEALQTHGDTHPVIISQAGSVDMLRGTTIPVVNFPLLQRLPNEIAEDWYLEVLDALLTRLDPAVIVEDTYPDPRYARLPSLADRPRVLVLRRLDGLSFNTLRTAGRLRHFDRVLVAQTPAEFLQEGHSGDSLACALMSPRFRFVGQIYRRPDPAISRRLRTQFTADGEALVVVNGGAGGDQMPDGYGDRLFSACDKVASRLHAAGRNVQFIFVTGSYYAGREPVERPGVTVRRFEPLLPELLAAADVAVIKPGHNGLSEALSGGAHLILIPDVSFMEGLDEHIARVVRAYGGHLATAETDRLESLLNALLDAPPRAGRLDSPDAAIAAVTDEIRGLATRIENIAIPARLLLLGLVPPEGVAPAKLSQQLPAPLKAAVVIGHHVQRASAVNEQGAAPTLAVLSDAVPRRTLGQLWDAGTRLMLANPEDAALRWWLRGPSDAPTMLSVPTTMVRADRSRPEHLHRHLHARILAGPPPAVVVDLSALDAGAALRDYLGTLTDWVCRQPLYLAAPDEVAGMVADTLLCAQ